MSKTEAAPAELQKPAQITVTLDEPLKRGDQTITSVTLRKPNSGELRGIALADLMRADVGALHAVLPRITQPALTAQDISQIDLADLAKIAGEVLGFFMSRADRKSLSPSLGA